MPYIDIPRFRQPGKSVLCGPTCVRMVLAYYGINMSLARIAGEMRMVKTGIDFGSLGIFLMKYGFKTELKFWMIGTEPRWFGTTDADTIKKILRTKHRHTNSRNWDFYRGRLLRYIEAGGCLKLGPIMPSDIEGEIVAKRPLIININSGVMNAFGRVGRGHYLVPNYIPDKDSQCTRPMIGYIDPRDGGEYLSYLEDIMFLNHIWEGGGLLIRKDKKSP